MLSAEGLMKAVEEISKNREFWDIFLDTGTW
jgi:hypothetical protein